ncbi:MAG: metalloregulator ArsR/SmtB family transcription factor [Clostridia bacterium]|nr:metalloregulator ArsR/SmtB family transcription factor [Clostridia bacterium]MBQ8381624.1 metalloregulator ArsR/SmtB family transcription factor [Clostridia bacterium]
MENAVAILKCLADQSRIAILNILARGDSYVELIASKLELTPATVCYHLKKLEAAGLVRCSRTQFYMIYSLNRELFDAPLSALLFTGDETVDREAAYRQKVLDSFLVNGRLLSLPAQQKKREIVLEKLAERFDPDRTYTEREMNAVILEYYDDFCTVRREMVGLGLMERDHGIYRRVRKE